MPNCFELINKETNKKADLKELDTELWEVFEGKEPEGNINWYRSWYNIIGLSLACGKTFDYILTSEYSEPIKQVAAYLASKYTVNAFYSH